MLLRRQMSNWCHINGTPSNATTTSAASVATTTTAPSAYICSSIDDCDASNRSTVSFVNAKDCTRTSRTICEYNTHGYIDVSFTDGTQTLNVFTTTNQAAGMETCMLRRDGGKLLYVDGSEQTGGTLLAMSAEHLTEGTGMHITGDDLVTGSLIKLSSKSTNVTNGILRMDTNDVRSGKLVSIEANKLEDGSAIDISNDGSSLSTGSLIKLSSKSTNVTNGILRMDTNDVRSGKLVSIEANKLEDGSAIDISNDGSSLSTGSLIKLTSNVKGDNNGANGLVKIVANDMTDGKGIVLEGKNLRKGTAIEITNNAHLTSGKLLHMKTSSPYAQNPVAVEASEMTNGVIMKKIEGDSLTSGSGLTLTTNQGSSMISSMSSQNIESIVSNDGRFLVNAKLQAVSIFMIK